MPDLEEELVNHHEEIHTQHTPLAWAAARGDDRAVITLRGQSKYHGCPTRFQGPYLMHQRKLIILYFRSSMRVPMQIYHFLMNEERERPERYRTNRQGASIYHKMAGLRS
jgi:hypothetical protein